jgi:hypothetical protein
MKFYIISRFATAEEGYVLIRDELLAQGHQITKDWYRDSVNHKALTQKRAAKAMQEDIEGIRQADVVIALPTGNKDWHTELGVALAFDKKVYMVIEAADRYQICGFYAHPNVIPVTWDILMGCGQISLVFPEPVVTPGDCNMDLPARKARAEWKKLVEQSDAEYTHIPYDPLDVFD